MTGHGVGEAAGEAVLAAEETATGPAGGEAAWTGPAAWTGTSASSAAWPASSAGLSARVPHWARHDDTGICFA